MNKYISWGMGILLLGSLTSCDSWEGDLIIRTGESACWNLADSLVVSAEINSSSVQPQVYIDFRPDYPYMNLQMSLSWKGPSDQTGEIDFQSTVVDPGGDWLIERKGNSFPLVLTLKNPVELSEKGQWTFSLSHNMREDAICEINEVGIRIDSE